MKCDFKHVAPHVLLAVAVVGFLYLVPPRLSLKYPRTVTVTGVAKQQKTNEMAQFTAGVNAVNDDKQKAVEEVNTKVTELIDAVKKFGIAPKDIKTQNLNIYQNQETVYEEGRQKQKMGQWNVGNTVEITLRDVQRADDLTMLLSESGANNVYGPNFSLDTEVADDTALVKDALKDAKSKAEAMAANSGAKLGKVLSMQEGYSGSPILYGDLKGMGGGGGNMETEVGSTTVSKTVTVTYELK